MHKGPEAAAKSAGDTAPTGRWAGERRREECRKEKSASLKKKKKKERRVGVGWASVRVCVFSSVFRVLVFSLCLVQSVWLGRVRVSLLGLLW